MQLSDIDLTDMDRFQDAFPHEWFTFLRREAPVWFHPPNDTVGNENGFWVVTKYEDVSRSRAIGSRSLRRRHPRTRRAGS